MGHGAARPAGPAGAGAGVANLKQIQAIASALGQVAIPTINSEIALIGVVADDTTIPIGNYPREAIAALRSAATFCADGRAPMSWPCAFQSTPAAISKSSP